MSVADFKIGDRVVVPMVVKAVDVQIGLILAQPDGEGEDYAQWFTPEELRPDHLTPPPTGQTAFASD